MTTAREETTRLADLLRREHHALAEFLVALAAFNDATQVAGARALLALLFPPPRARALEGRRLLPQDRGGPRPEIPRGRRRPAGGQALPTSVVELSKVLTPENRAEILPRFFHASKREAKEIAARDPAHAGAAPADRRHHRPSRRRRAGACARRCFDRRRPMRRGFGSSGQPHSCQPVHPRWGVCVVTAASGTGEVPAAHRRAEPHPRHRLAPPPRQARRRPRRPLALPPGRDRGADPRGRARPHPAAVREAPRPRREAAEGASSLSPTGGEGRGEGAVALTATCPPRSGAGSGSATTGAARGRSRAAASAAPPGRSSSTTCAGSPSARRRPSTSVASCAAGTRSSRRDVSTATRSWTATRAGRVGAARSRLASTVALMQGAPAHGITRGWRGPEGTPLSARSVRLAARSRRERLPNRR